MCIKIITLERKAIHTRTSTAHRHTWHVYSTYVIHISIISIHMQNEIKFQIYLKGKYAFNLSKEQILLFRLIVSYNRRIYCICNIVHSYTSNTNTCYLYLYIILRFNRALKSIAFSANKVKLHALFRHILHIN